MVRAMCGVGLKDRKRSTDLMLILCLSETIDQLAMANSVRWNGDALMREDGHVLRIALELEVEGQRKKERLKRTWIKHVEEECEDWFKRGRCTLPIEVECWHKSDCRWVEVNMATHLLGMLPDYKRWCLSLSILKVKLFPKFCPNKQLQSK